MSSNVSLLYIKNIIYLTCLIQDFLSLRRNRTDQQENKKNKERNDLTIFHCIRQRLARPNFFLKVGSS